jgi:signal transduction histidine kinase
VSTLSDIPEEKKSLIGNAIGRISDIANDLLDKSKVNIRLESNSFLYSKGKASSLSPTAPDFLCSPPDLVEAVINALVAEKKVQFSDQGIVLSISGNFSSRSACIDVKELSRILSNILNNAAESVVGMAGKINISLEANNKFLQINVLDNGIGIPEDVLGSLGKTEMSFGKEGFGSQAGSGLGVYNAKKYLDSIGGSIKFFSRPSEGTLVQICIPVSR